MAGIGASTMRVLSLELTDVRRFAHKRFEFRPGFNLLVGENGEGKSTVLRSLMTVLGRGENFRSADRLGDDDIRRRAPELQVGVEYQIGDNVGTTQITHRWREATKRIGRVAPSTVLWFGPTEATTRTLLGQRVRQYRDSKNEKWRRDDFWHREEFLYREEFMEPPDEEEHTPFGRSEHVRGFVGEVLRRFSPKFERFVWRFLPYDCVVQVPESLFSKIDDANEFRSEVRAEIMRYLDDDFPPRRYYRGWGSQRAITFKANGEPASGSKRVRSMPEFREILRSAGRRFKSVGELEGVTIQVRLAPRISVMGPDGPLLLSQLSDGEKRIFSMLVDIARHLSLLPGGWREIASGSGLVMIDEIDCHLHPKWQRMIVSALEDLFPACQFIATTHSPFVVQAVEEHQLQSLGAETLPDFTDRGIEEIAFKVMRIENHQVSPRYLELLDVAKEYYATLEQARGAAGARKEELRAKLRSLSGRYVRNPAFQAFLEMRSSGLLGPEVDQ
jgi:predicted ATPase